jgi:flagellar basal-body rod modification protein FlgD
MAVDTTAAAQNAAATSKTAASPTTLGRTRLADNFDTFLTLLTTQLKNQDPLSPMDSNQFTQQLVAMSGVEQQLLTNDLLTKISNAGGQGIADAVSLIGKQVSAVSDTAGLSNGKAEWAYKLDRAAADVKIEVLDAKGVVVHSEAVANAPAGETAFTWDGKDSTGKKLSDGTYTLKITAADSQGVKVASTTYVRGVVTGVEQVDGKTLITLGGAKIDWTKVNSITDVAKTATTTPTTPVGKVDTTPTDPTADA